MKKIIPNLPDVMHEGLLMLGGALVAAFLLSRFPKLKQLVQSNSLTVKDDQGNVMY